MKWRVDQRKLGREIVEKDCKACGLNREDTMDCSRWRKKIEMIDDHNECEWVNVSSSTGSPRLCSVMEFGEAIKNPAYRIPQTEYSGCLDVSAHA